jgi:hypothetical protein
MMLTSCSQEEPMHRDVRPRERLQYLITLMELAHERLQRAEELRRQAVDLLKEAEAYHRRIASSSRPPADSAGTARYGS